MLDIHGLMAGDSRLIPPRGQTSRFSSRAGFSVSTMQAGNLRQSRVRGRLRLPPGNYLRFRTRSAMNETKADMYGSYLAVFSFAIVMIVLPLFFDSKVGSVLWALVAWQIYRRDKPIIIGT